MSRQEPEFLNKANLPAAEAAALAALVTGHRSVKHALDWFLGQSPPVAPEDVLGQDEFSFDLLFPLDGGRYLVYDVS